MAKHLYSVNNGQHMLLILISLSCNKDFLDSIQLELKFFSANYYHFHIVGKVNDAYRYKGWSHATVNDTLFDAWLRQCELIYQSKESHYSIRKHFVELAAGRCKYLEYQREARNPSIKCRLYKSRKILACCVLLLIAYI